ncbi:MAG: NAD(P)/FAD-dependent oxidoreductase [Actinomycetota bacterium]
MRRSLFDDFLPRAAAQRGAEVRFTPVLGAWRERKGVRVMGADGSLYRAEVLVGADGVNGGAGNGSGCPAVAGNRSSCRQTFLSPGKPRISGTAWSWI